MTHALPRAVALFAFVVQASVLGGEIRGAIANPELCAGVSAIRRAGTPTRLRTIETKGAFDPQTGEFSVTGLEPEVYDLRILLKGGGIIDGARMKMQEDEESHRPLADDDRKMIEEFIENHPVSFIDIYRCLRIEGNGDFARVLVEQIRHRDYHSGKGGDIVWRMEVWKFENHTGAWVKGQHGWHVLARERISDTGARSMTHEQFSKLTWLFDPELDDFEILANGTVVEDVEYKVPDKLDASMGKTPGSVESQIEADREKRRKKAEHDGLE